MANVTSSGGASVQATLNLNIEPFESQITLAKEKLDALLIPLDSINTDLNKVIISSNKLNTEFQSVGSTISEVGDKITVMDKLDSLISKVTRFEEGFAKILTPLESINTKLESTGTHLNKAQSNIVKVQTALNKTISDERLLLEPIVKLNTELEKTKANYVQMGELNTKNDRLTQQVLRNRISLIEEEIRAEQSKLNIIRFGQDMLRDQNSIETRNLNIINKEISLRKELTNLTKSLNTYSEKTNQIINTNITKQRERLELEKLRRSSLKQINDLVTREGTKLQQLNEFSKQFRLSIAEGSTEMQRQARNTESWNDAIKFGQKLLKTYKSEFEELTVFSKEFGASVKQGTTEMERQAIISQKIETSANELSFLLQKDAEAMKELTAFSEEFGASIKKNNTAMQKQANLTKQTASASKTNSLDKLSGIPRRTASMFVTMAGFNEMMNVYELSKEYSQAVEQIDYFSKRLKMSQTQFVGYQKELQNLQSQFQKVDMYSVGASAEESALKYKLPINALGELTKAYAVTSSAFVKEGRTQEDAILAVNDAMDGQFRRMYELDGNFKDHLKEAGWSGDLKDKASMLNAFNKVLNDMGFEQTAKDITSFNDAVTVAEIKISQDLGGAFHKIEPLLVNIGKLFIGVIEGLEGFSNWLDSTFGSKTSDFVLNFILTLGIELGILWGAFKGYKAIKNTYQELKLFTQTVNTTVDSVKKGIPKLSEWWAKLRGKDSTTGGTGGDLTTTRGKIKKQNDELKKTTKEMDTVGKTAQTSGTTVKKSQTRFQVAKNNIKTASVYIFGALLIIVGALALIMGGIALIGAEYQALKPQVDSGKQALEQLAPLVISILVPVSVFAMAMQYYGKTINPATVKDSVIGIALGLGLVAEAILMLTPSLISVGVLGYVNNWLGDNVDQGIQAINKLGQVLQALVSPVGLLLIGATLLGAVLVSTGGIGIGVLFASIIVGMTTISAGILSLALPLLGIAGLGYLNDQLGGSVNSGIQAISKISIAIQKIAQTIKPLISAIQTIVDALSGWGIIQGALTGLSLGAKLGEIITVVTEIMSFATKLGTVTGDGGGANTTAVASISNGISKLTSTIQRFVTSINGKATQLRSAGVRLGRALPSGFTQGATGFNAKVNQIIQGAVMVVLASNGMWSMGGRTMGLSLVNGFKSTSNTLRKIVNTEIDYAIQQANSRKQDMYNTGADLGRSFSDGFSSTKGLDQHSPGLVARTTAQEIVYALQSIDKGVSKMYSAGANLGSSLSSGYNSNFKTDMSSVKSVGGTGSSNGLGLSIVTSPSSNDTTNNNTKNNSTILNISFDGATFIGESDYKETMKKIAQEVFIDYNTPSKHTGY